MRLPDRDLLRIVESAEAFQHGPIDDPWEAVTFLRRDVPRLVAELLRLWQQEEAREFGEWYAGTQEQAG